MVLWIQQHKHMNKATAQIDWNAVEDKANEMTQEAIAGTIVDILLTLGPADSLDRKLGGFRGGYYRDELSIYRKVLRLKRST